MLHFRVIVRRPVRLLLGIESQTPADGWVVWLQSAQEVRPPDPTSVPSGTLMATRVITASYENG